MKNKITTKDEYKQGKLSKILFGLETDSNYGGNSPGLLMLLGPFSVPIYLIRHLTIEKRYGEKESNLKKEKI